MNWFLSESSIYKILNKKKNYLSYRYLKFDNSPYISTLTIYYILTSASTRSYRISAKTLAAAAAATSSTTRRLDINYHPISASRTHTRTVSSSLESRQKQRQSHLSLSLLSKSAAALEHSLSLSLSDARERATPSNSARRARRKIQNRNSTHCLCVKPACQLHASAGSLSLSL